MKKDQYITIAKIIMPIICIGLFSIQLFAPIHAASVSVPVDYAIKKSEIESEHMKSTRDYIPLSTAKLTALENLCTFKQSHKGTLSNNEHTISVQKALLSQRSPFIHKDSYFVFRIKVGSSWDKTPWPAAGTVKLDGSLDLEKNSYRNLVGRFFGAYAGYIDSVAYVYFILDIPDNGTEVLNWFFNDAKISFVNSGHWNGGSGNNIQIAEITVDNYTNWLANLSTTDILSAPASSTPTQVIQNNQQTVSYITYNTPTTNYYIYNTYNEISQQTEVVASSDYFIEWMDQDQINLDFRYSATNNFYGLYLRDETNQYNFFGKILCFYIPITGSLEFDSINVRSYRQIFSDFQNALIRIDNGYLFYVSMFSDSPDQTLTYDAYNHINVPFYFFQGLEPGDPIPLSALNPITGEYVTLPVVGYDLIAPDDIPDQEQIDEHPDYMIIVKYNYHFADHNPDLTTITLKFNTPNSITNLNFDSIVYSCPLNSYLGKQIIEWMNNLTTIRFGTIYKRIMIAAESINSKIDGLIGNLPDGSDDIYQDVTTTIDTYVDLNNDIDAVIDDLLSPLDNIPDPTDDKFSIPSDILTIANGVKESYDDMEIEMMSGGWGSPYLIAAMLILIGVIII